MSDYFISSERAGSDLLDCAAFLAERIKSSDGHAEAMGEIVPRYLAKGDVDLAAELSNAVDDPFSRDRLLISVAEKCADLDDDEYALQLAEAVEDHGLAAQALERLALVKAGKGQADQAAQIAEGLEHPDFVYAGVAIHLAANGGEVEAREFLERIEFPAARSGGLQHIAASHINNGNIELAVANLDAAVEAADAIEHDEERLRALCDIGNLFNDANRKDKAIETFAKARDGAELLENIHRDFFLVNCALGFLYSGSEELCDRTLDLVMDKTQMASAMLGMARDAWRKELKDEAADHLAEAYEIIRSQRDFETRDSKARNAVFTSIAVQFAVFGNFERAVEVAQENQDPSEQDSALSQIAQVFASRGADGLAREALNSIPEDANRIFALVAMSDVKKRLDENDAAIALLEEAATMAETVPQLSVRSAVLNEIASRFAAFGQTDKVRDAVAENLGVIQEIRDESSQAVSLAGIADVYAAAQLELTDSEREFLTRFVGKVDW